MFDSIRNHKKYLMGFLLILIIPSFVLFGIQADISGKHRQLTQEMLYRLKKMELQANEPSPPPKDGEY